MSFFFCCRRCRINLSCRKGVGKRRPAIPTNRRAFCSLQMRNLFYPRRRVIPGPEVEFAGSVENDRPDVTLFIFACPLPDRRVHTVSRLTVFSYRQFLRRSRTSAVASSSFSGRVQTSRAPPPPTTPQRASRHSFFTSVSKELLHRRGIIHFVRVIYGRPVRPRENNGTRLCAQNNFILRPFAKCRLVEGSLSTRSRLSAHCTPRRTLLPALPLCAISAPTVGSAFARENTKGGARLAWM